MEFSAGTNIPIGDVQIGVKANYSFNHSKILNLAGQDTVLRGGTQVLIEGEPLSSFYSYDVMGVWQKNEAQQASKYNRKPGDFKYRDVNGDGQYTTADRTVLGQAEPKYHYGLNFNVDYKGFDLSMFWQGAGGNKINNRTLFHQIAGYDGSEDPPVEILNYWRPDNPSNSVPSIVSTDPIFEKNSRNISQYIEDGDYLRLKSLTLGYNFSGRILERLNLSKLRVYISSQNLLTFTEYKGQDPQVIGRDYYNYPFTISFRGGVNIGF